jgi:ADP-ribose pyrophosphatase YjhB (NUDIX family)
MALGRRRLDLGESSTVSEIDTATDNTWLSSDDLEQIRAQMPIVYVEAVPVRVDALGNVTEIGLLLRQAADGTISRLIVSGRVKFGERVREALLRHCEKDLGPLAFPRIPVEPSPFTVAEYFPDADVTGYHDPRQHAVSLAYVVPVEGECEPTQEALDLAWYTPTQVVSPSVIGQMTSGQDRLLRLALASVGQLP